jgi:hypothetical protein
LNSLLTVPCGGHTTANALRTPGLEPLARWQIDSYSRIVSEWCEDAAAAARETCAVPFETLGRVIVGSVIGIVLHYLGDRDPDLARRDVDATTEMLVRLAAVRPTSAGEEHPAPSA